MSSAKAIALLSGGLDSQLAVKLMLEQGVEIVALHYESPLCVAGEGEDCAAPARRAAEALGVPLVVYNTWDQILDAVNHPRHGHGRGVNPCIDCRIIHFGLARRLMEEEGADFIVSGEVLGQRPMSQHKRALATIEREAGVEGKVLRPLSALGLAPTEPERTGLVDRQRLRGFQGRNRKPQMALAAELGLEDYPSPAGGCVLTEPGFGVRYRRLRRYLSEQGMGEVDARRGLALLSGRHFLSSRREWITIGRNEAENERLAAMTDVFSASGRSEEVPGPVAALLTVARPHGDTLREAADLAARYGQGREHDVVEIRFAAAGGAWEDVLPGDPRRGRDLTELLERV